MSQPVFTTPTSTETDRTGRRYFALIVPIVLAAMCLWMAMPKAAVSRGVGFQPANVQPENLSSQVTTLSGRNATTVSLPAASPKLITRPIEDIRPGMRVLASNPDETDESERVDFINELDWQLVQYRMEKADGSSLYISQLERAADLKTVVPAMQVALSFPELAIEGPADVLAIQECPSIESGSGEVVTATFHHTAANVIALQIASETQPIGTTSNHPFWSEDRFDWVQAGDLQCGERLRLIDGTLTTVETITFHPRTQPVYNLTVNALHTYHIGDSGVLVHNTKNYNLPGIKKITIDIGHVLSGHTAGGSRVSALKDLFPATMNSRHISAAIKDAYKGAKLLQTQGDRLRVQGTSHGLTIEMWVNKATNIIETAYPVH